jgi:tripartite-type tricarboxylate transporter receptor subunit TctC
VHPVHQGRHAARAGGDNCDPFGCAADIPTLAEFVPGYESSQWYGVGAPKDTPAEVIDKLNKEINAVTADPLIKARLAGLGVDPMSMTSAAFGSFIADEAEKWGKVIRAANIKAE